MASIRATRFEYMEAVEKFLKTESYASDNVLEISGKTKPWTSHFGRLTTTQFPAVDAEALPFEDESYDCVIMNQVLEHCKRPWLCVGEASRVLRKGGMLIMSSPFIYQVHDWPGDYYRFTPEGLICLGKSAGLTEVLLNHRGGNPSMLKHAINYPQDRCSEQFVNAAKRNEDKSLYFMSSTVVMRK